MKMPSASDLNDLLKTFYTINEKLERMEKDLRDMRNEVSAVRTAHSDLQSRVAILEENRKTVEAQMRAVVAETVADLRVQFLEAKMEMRESALRQTPPQLPGASDDTR
jgi:predicted  nucleic acid-binding Zn-ribbon protein